MKKFLIILITIFVSFLYVSCKEKGEEKNIVEEINITGMKDIYVGESLQLNVAEADNVIWTVEKGSVIHVESNGIITGVSKGMGIVKATLEDDASIYSYAIVNVLEREIYAESITITGKDKLKVGEYSYYQANIRPEGVSEDVIWQTSNSDILTIENGVVCGVKEGIATIKVMLFSDENIYAEKEIEVIKEKAIAEYMYIEGDKTIKKGDTSQLGVVIYPVVLESVNLIWESSDESVVTVTDGLINAVGAGEAYVTVRAPEINKEVTTLIIVEDSITVENVEILNKGNGVSKYMKTGDVISLQYKVYPYLATTNILWESSDKSVAIVNEYGEVTALNEGSVTITIKSKSNDQIKDSINIEVVSYDINLAPISINVIGGNTMELGYPAIFKSSVEPVSANPIVRWESSNDEIIQIDENGVALALKAGKAKIRAVSVVDENVKSEWLEIKIPNGCLFIPDLLGYEIVIKTDPYMMKTVNPFMDAYTKHDKMYLQKAWKEIEKKYNCTIKVGAFPLDIEDYTTYLIDNYNNEAVDSDITLVNIKNIPVLANAGVLAEIGQYYETYETQMIQFMKDLGTFNGKMYAVPTGINEFDNYVNLGLYYNVNLLNDLGINNPINLYKEGKWNYSEFLNWCLQAQSKLDGKYVISGDLYYWWLGLVNTTGEKIVDNVNATFNIDSERVVEAGELIYKLVNSGAAYKEEMLSGVFASFEKEEVIMTSGLLSDIGKGNKWDSKMFGEDTEYGYVPFPYPDDYNADNIYTSVCYDLGVMVFNNGIKKNCPKEIKLTDIYIAITDLYELACKYEKNDPTSNRSEIIYDSLYKHVDNPNSLMAVADFSYDKIIYDAAHIYYESDKDTPLREYVIKKYCLYQEDIDDIINKYKEDVIYKN